jgi:hypothetical protein
VEEGGRECVRERQVPVQGSRYRLAKDVLVAAWKEATMGGGQAQWGVVVVVVTIIHSFSLGRDRWFDECTGLVKVREKEEKRALERFLRPVSDLQASAEVLLLLWP